jgi:hypothetical protein
MGRIRRGHPRGDRNRRLYQPGMIRVPKRLSPPTWWQRGEVGIFSRECVTGVPRARRPGVEANRASAAADKLE